MGILGKGFFVKILVYSLACIALISALFFLFSGSFSNTGLVNLAGSSVTDSLEQNPASSYSPADNSSVSEGSGTQAGNSSISSSSGSSGTGFSGGAGGFSGGGVSGGSSDSGSSNSSQSNPSGSNSGEDSEKEFTAVFSPSVGELLIIEGESIEFSISASKDANFEWQLDGMQVETGKNFTFKTIQGFEGTYLLQASVKSNSEKRFNAWSIRIGKSSSDFGAMSLPLIDGEQLTSEDLNAFKKLHSSLKQLMLSKPSTPETIIITVSKQEDIDAVVEELENLGAVGIQPIKPGVLIVAELASKSLAKLAKNSEVKFVNPNFTYYAMETEDKINPNILQVKAPSIWAKTLQDQNITGKGVKVAILDTGINSRHTILGSRTTDSNLFTTLSGSENDDFGHGAHVTGITAGGMQGAIYHDVRFPNSTSTLYFQVPRTHLRFIEYFGSTAGWNFSDGNWSLGMAPGTLFNSFKCSITSNYGCKAERATYDKYLSPDENIVLYTYFSNPIDLNEWNIIIKSSESSYNKYSKTLSLPLTQGWYRFDIDLNNPTQSIGSFTLQRNVLYKIGIETVYSTAVSTEDFFDSMEAYPKYCWFFSSNFNSSDITSNDLLYCRQDFNSAGVAPQASIVNVKVLGDSGTGFSTEIAQGMAWAVSAGVKVMNLSLGRAVNDPSDPVVTQMTALHNDYNVNFIVAAGNCRNPGQCQFDYIGTTTPGISPDAISVGAVDYSNQIASFSSPGTVEGKPNLVAPGVNVYSSFKASSTVNYSSDFDTNAILSGTSMSTPHVSGAVALMLQANPNLSWQKVKALLERNALDLGVQGFDTDFGWGLLDLNRFAVRNVWFSENLVSGSGESGIVFEKTVALSNDSVLDLNLASIIPSNSRISAWLDKNNLSAFEETIMHVRIDSNNYVEVLNALVTLAFTGSPVSSFDVNVSVSFNDTSAPITILGINSNWQNFDVNAGLVCSDNGGSGCALTQFRLDSDASDAMVFSEWQDYSMPVLFSGDGNYAIDFNSTDVLGNVEETKREFVLIDGNVPTVPEFNAVADFNGTIISWTQSIDDKTPASGMIYKIFKSQGYHKNYDLQLLETKNGLLSLFDPGLKAVVSKPSFKNAGSEGLILEWRQEIDSNEIINYMVYASDLAGNESNLLPNASFEDWDYGSGSWSSEIKFKPVDWNGNWAVDLIKSNEAVSGKHSVLFSTPINWEWAGFFRQYSNYAEYAGRKFKVSVWVKGDSANISKRMHVCLSPYIWSYFVDSPLKTRHQCLGQRLDINLQLPDWQEYSFIGEIPENISRPFFLPVTILIGCTDSNTIASCKATVRQPEKAWFDAFEMKEIKPAAANQSMKQYWILRLDNNAEYGPFTSQTTAINELNAETKYCFKIKATDFSDNNSAWSEASCSFTSVPAPTSLQADHNSQHPLNSETAGVHLTWQANGASDGFSIYRSTDGINFEKIGIAEYPTSVFDDIDASDNSFYYYKVGAFGGSADANSNTASIATFDRTMPSTPEFSTLQAGNSITLSWLASTDNITPQEQIVYAIFKSSSKNNFSSIAAGISGTSYNDTNAVDANPPQAPAGITAGNPTSSTLDVNWNAGIDFGTDYNYFMASKDLAGNESGMLKNASFEKYVNSGEEFKPAEWDVNTDFVRMTVSKSKDAKIGNYAVRLSTPFVWEWGAMYKKYSDYLLQAGKKYFVSFWIKGNEGNTLYYGRKTYSCFSPHLIDRICYGGRADINLSNPEWNYYSFAGEIPAGISRAFYLTLPLRVSCGANVGGIITDTLECMKTVNSPLSVLVDGFEMQEIKTANSTSGIKQYWVLDLNTGIEYGPFPSTNASISGLEPGIEHCFKAKARDFADNNSSYSEQACAETLPS